MSVFKEFEHLLPHDLVVIRLVVSTHRLELVDHIDDLLLCGSAFDHILESCQVLHRVEEDLAEPCPVAHHQPHVRVARPHLVSLWQVTSLMQCDAYPEANGEPSRPWPHKLL